MNKGTVVIVHRDTLLFRDMMYIARTAGYSTFRAGVTAASIISAMHIYEPDVILIEREALPEKDITLTMMRILELSNSVQVFVIGELEREELQKLAFSARLTAIQPPINVGVMLAAVNTNPVVTTLLDDLRRDIYYHIESLMLTLGITRTMTGHSPMREALFYMVTSKESRHSMSTVVYPHTAAKLAVTTHAVERGIRLTIAEIWNDLTPNTRKMLAPDLDDTGASRPTNKVFLTAVSDYIRCKLNYELEYYRRLVRA